MNSRHSITEQFYGSLLLLRLLTPRRPSGVSARNGLSNVNKYRNAWQKFLDKLAWLADHRCGGQTVTAIAVEKTTRGPKYWVAGNNQVRQEAVDHIQDVVMQLERVDANDPQGIDVLMRQIAKKSMEFSWPRVRDYRRRLKATLNAINLQGFATELGSVTCNPMQVLILDADRLQQMQFEATWVHSSTLLMTQTSSSTCHCH